MSTHRPTPLPDHLRQIVTSLDCIAREVWDYLFLRGPVISNYQVTRLAKLLGDKTANATSLRPRLKPLFDQSLVAKHSVRIAEKPLVSDGPIFSWRNRKSPFVNLPAEKMRYSAPLPSQIRRQATVFSLNQQLHHQLADEFDRELEKHFAYTDFVYDLNDEQLDEIWLEYLGNTRWPNDPNCILRKDKIGNVIDEISSEKGPLVRHLFTGDLAAEQLDNEQSIKENGSLLVHHWLGLADVFLALRSSPDRNKKLLENWIPIRFHYPNSPCPGIVYTRHGEQPLIIGVVRNLSAQRFFIDIHNRWEKFEAYDIW